MHLTYGALMKRLQKKTTNTQHSVHINDQSWRQGLVQNNADRLGGTVHCSLFVLLSLDCVQYVPLVHCCVDDCSPASSYGYTIHRAHCGTRSCQVQRCSKFHQPATGRVDLNVPVCTCSFSDCHFTLKDGV